MPSQRGPIRLELVWTITTMVFLFLFIARRFSQSFPENKATAFHA